MTRTRMFNTRDCFFCGVDGLGNHPLRGMACLRTKDLVQGMSYDRIVKKNELA